MRTHPRQLGIVLAAALLAATSIPAVASAATTAPSVPAAPRSVVVIGLDSRARVRWLPPAPNGSSPITDYLVQTSRDGVTWTTFPDGRSTVPATIVTGLQNGHFQRVRVAARNVRGRGAWSAVATAMLFPTACPLAFTLGGFGYHDLAVGVVGTAFKGIDFFPGIHLGSIRSGVVSGDCQIFSVGYAGFVRIDARNSVMQYVHLSLPTLRAAGRTAALGAVVGMSEDQTSLFVADTLDRFWRLRRDGTHPLLLGSAFAPCLPSAVPCATQRLASISTSALSRDGRRVYQVLSAAPFGLIERDLVTGAVRHIAANVDLSFATTPVTLSRDGRWACAAASFVRLADGMAVPNPYFDFGGDDLGCAGWLPDGRAVIVNRDTLSAKYYYAVDPRRPTPPLVPIGATDLSEETSGGSLAAGPWTPLRP